MIRFVIFLMFLLLNSSLFAQSDLKGTVLSNGNAVSNVEVINITKKISQKTDAKGVFTIQASAGDEIVLVANNYNEKKLKVTREQFNSNLVVGLDKKTTELKELEIVKTERFKVDTSYESLKMEKLARDESKAKVVGVYTGEIEKGTDFVEIGKKLYKLVGKMFVKSEDKVAPKKVERFNHYVRRNFSDEFFKTKLNLKEDEIDPFITFCENDIKSKDVTQKNGALDVLEFMLEKRKEYQN